ncbi:MAG: DUF3558 domain-containing protein [Nocardiaceae bacterium]|nr:DUF3558 domain-containing protein [Nocardiaceae bacterium]
MKKRFAGSGIAVAIAITASGCANTTEGHALAKEPPKPALAASVSTESADFDPCKDLSDDDLIDADLRPSTKNTLPTTDSRACRWESYDGWYDVGIFAHDFGLDELEDDPEVVVLGHLTLRGHRTLVLSSKDTHSDLCVVAMEGGSGTVAVVPYVIDSSTAPREDLCDVALTNAKAIVAAVPAV